MLRAFVLFAFVPVFILAEYDTLYSFEKHLVWELDSNNFHSWAKSTSRRHSSVVQFYSAASERSQLYVSVYSQAAHLTQSWSEFLLFYAIDCDNVENFFICKKYGFKHAPVVRYFPSRSKSENVGMKIPAFIDPNSLLKQIVKRLNVDYLNGNCPNCPNLIPLPDIIATLTDVWKFSKEQPQCIRQIVVVPVEDLDHPAGVTRLLQVSKAVGQFNDSSVQLPVYRAAKSHPLICLPHVKIAPWELLMFTRQSNWNRFPTKMAFDDASRLVSQMPIGPARYHAKKTNDCNTPPYELNSYSLADIAKNFNNNEVKNKTESFCQHWTAHRLPLLLIHTFKIFSDCQTVHLIQLCLQDLF
ncbi:hypothetical protein M3Y97_01029100 [Aphelenchoides bicaudatus]|nr:hypothetical protein M3Y97_01029100 [Aphelenchoides bicaudatus]